MQDYFKHKASDWDSPMKVTMTEKFVSEVLKNIKINKTLKAMDLGCGTGLVGLQFADQLKSIVMLDSSRAMTDKLKEKLLHINENDISPDAKIIIVNGSIDKYNTNDIDIIFSLMAFHHFEDISSTMEQVSKILQPGGILVIGDLKEEDGSFHGDEVVPHKGFNIELLAKQIENAGLDIVITYTYNSMQKGDKNYEQFILIANKTNA